MSDGTDKNYFLNPARKCKNRFHGKNKPKPRTRLRSKSKKMRERDKIYIKLRAKLLKERPICECWLQENGWQKFGDDKYRRCGGGCMAYDSAHLLHIGALPSESCHHKAGRGRYYLDYETFMAVSNYWHRWLEDHKDEARAKGWIVDAKLRRPLKLP